MNVAAMWFQRGLFFFTLLLTARAMAAGDFALIDEQGVFHQLSRYSESEAVVLLLQQADDAFSQQQVAELEKLRAQYEEQPVVFLTLDPGKEPRRKVSFGPRPHNDDTADAIPVLLDTAQIVTATLGARRLGEVFVLNPSSQRLIHRGSVQELGEVLRAVLAGEDLAFRDSSSAQGEPPVEGAAIRFSYQEAFAERQISYEQEIAPLLMKRCAHCHVDNGLAPWAMDRYVMILGWSPMIRETLVTRRMPPGQLDGQVGQWLDTHELSDAELALLVHWIDNGAPQDGGEDPLTQLRPLEPAWELGEPDVIIDVPEEQVPATGVIDFRLKQASLDLPEDKWLRAVAYDVGDKSVLHSLLVYTRDREAEISAPGDLIDAEAASFISIYVPGRSVEQFPADSGFLLAADRDLSFKLRYTSSGRETVDRTRIGLYFHDAPPPMAMSTIELRNEDIYIPANRDNHREYAESEVTDRQVYIESFSPHAHNRGKSMRIALQYPDGSQELLANVANYNFNWQLAYTLEERKMMPAGSRLLAETIYDNSAANPHNPDSQEEIAWGESTWAEMFSHFVRVLEPR